MANSGSRGIAEYWDFFAADTVAGGAAGSDGAAADGVAWLGSSDAGDTPFARAVAAARGIHVTGATDTSDNDMVEFCSDTLMFYGQTGHSTIEILAQFDVVTTLAFNFGFNDDVLDTSNTLPVELSGTTFTANAGTFVGMVYDVDADNDDVHCYWVDGAVATSTAIADLRMKGAAPVASKWMRLRAEIQDRGSGNGARVILSYACDGKTFEKTFNTSITRTTALCFYFGFENRDGVAHNCYIKYAGWTQTIAD